MGMYYGKRNLICTGVLAVILGAALHFLYRFLPCAITALVSPVNESLWEHVKLVYWPYLLSALWLNRGRPGGSRPWLLTLPVLCTLMLVLGYLYHVKIGGEALWVDIVIYAAVMALGFWLPTQFSGPFQKKRWVLPIFAAILLGVLIGVFTLWPPESIVFADLSSANAWFQLPC